MTGRSVIAIPEPRLERTGDLWRISATVAGTEVFFESRTPLSPRSEVLVCPFLLPAMSLHADLDVAGALDSRFHDNLAFVRDRARQWWPALSGGEVRAPVSAAAAPGPDSGVFYTGGVDSSYVLQQLQPRLRYTVFVEGFDTRLENEDRLRRTREWLGATAEACGLEFIVIRTNLRQHPVFNLARWSINHIGALAALGHALGPHVHTMYVAASDVPPPHGSAPDLDAARSSGSVKIENFGSKLSRIQRVTSIAKWETLRGRLRVCWNPRTRELNCGTCEKCIRSQMQLLVSGSPDGLGSFRTGPPLRSALGDLEKVNPHLAGQWHDIAAALQDRRLLKEVERLLAGRPRPYWRRKLRELRRSGGSRLRAAFTRETKPRHASA